jgi:hypothetical protein
MPPECVTPGKEWKISKTTLSRYSDKNDIVFSQLTMLISYAATKIELARYY